MGRDYRREKALSIRRARGEYFLVDSGPVRRHIALLHERHGMTYEAIAEQAGTPSTSLYIRSARMHPDRAARILAVRAPTDPVKVDQRRRARVLCTGAERRLNALTLEGWTIPVMADRFGVDPLNLRRLLKRRKVRISIALRDAIAELYNSGEHPIEIPELTRNKATLFAMRRNAAPRHCWDPDTIDDPDAIPEWTGECGTRAGYSIHLRERQKTFWDPGSQVWRYACLPCRTAQAIIKASVGL